MTATAPLEEAPACGSIMPAIPFNMPYTTGEELDGIQQAIGRLHLSGDGHFTRLCQDLLAQRFGSASALLTVSCTAVLEMSMLLLDIGPGDEVILPSFTFVSTANYYSRDFSVRADISRSNQRVSGIAVVLSVRVSP